MKENKRPWGEYQIIRKDKILKVKPNSKLSYQYHENRTEFWTVLEGEGIFQIGDLVLRVKVGDHYEIKNGIKHRIITENMPLVILEKAVGNVEEDDIIRMEDDYDRS